MKITKRQLRRIIREAKGSTKKYDDDSALRGGQSKLPDGLQKGIIDKTVEDREEHEEEEREEKNESVRITRRQLRRIIREIYVGEEKWDAYQGYREPPDNKKVGDLVRKIDYYGTGYGEDYKKTVGDEIGQVIEIDEDPDGTQYTVLFPDGSTIMDTGDEFEIVSEAYGGARGSFPERYGDAHERYVVERSGVSWDERFFVEITGWRPERIVYGPFEQAKRFPSKISAEKVQVTIDEMDGFFTRVQPVSFFEE